ASLRAHAGMLAHLQPARCAPCHFGDRAPTLHPARARPRPRLRSGLLRHARSAWLSPAQGQGGMSATLLIEIGVEELPPGAMRPLMDAFADTIVAGLDDAGLVFGAVSRYATPRRLAVAITDTAAKTPPRTIKKTGPAIAIAYDAEGQPTAAAEGFARAVGVPLAELITLDSDKGPRLAYQDEQPGEPLAALLPAVVEQALRQLPIARRMRWGSSSAEFVRPVHWVVSMHGTQLLPLTVFGIAAGTETHGHRLHYPAPIALAAADDYVERLRAPG